MDITVKVEAHELAAAITLLAEAIGYFTASQKPGKTEKKQNEPVVEAKTEQPEQVDPPKQKKVTFGQIQQKAAEKMRTGKRDEVKALLTKYSAEKISDITEDQRESFLAELEAL